MSDGEERERERSLICTYSWTWRATEGGGTRWWGGREGHVAGEGASKMECAGGG